MNAPLTPKSDQYSLAATTYEMLAGEPPHTGATSQAVIARKLSEPMRAIRVVRPAVPAHVEGALERALQRLPADRFASIAAFATALQGSGGAAVPGAPRMAEGSRRRQIGFAAAVALALTAGALWVVQRRPPPDEPTTHVTLAFAGDAKFVSWGGVGVALSADGSQLVYSAGADALRLYLKKRGDAEPTRLIGSDGASNPVFTPDERWIAFVADGALKKVPVSGGVPISIADSVARFSWGGDVVVVRRPGGVLARVDADGGAPELIIGPDTARHEREYTWPHVLPGGEAVLFNISLGTAPDSFEVAAVRLADRTIVRLGLHCVNPRYVSAGYLLCARTDGTVIAAPFDATHLRVTGPAETVLEQVEVRGLGAANFAVSRNGTLVYVAKASETELVTIDRAGRANAMLADQGRVGGPRVSPDGKRLVFFASRGPNILDVWVYDFGARVLTRVTTDGRSFFPNWSPDGRSIIWFHQHRDKGSVQWQRWDGSEPESTLVDSAGGTWVSRAGNFVLFRAGRRPESIALDSRRRSPVRPPARTGWTQPAMSTDGRWLAYQAIVEGIPEVFIEPFPTTGASHQVSVRGGAEPVWAPGGRELFYLARGSLWAATIASTPRLAVIRRDSLFAFSPWPAGVTQSYDVMPDGRSFVAARLVAGDTPPVLVTGWFAELRARMAGATGR